MAKVSNEKKLEALKDWLKENNIKYVEKHKSQFGVIIDLKIPSLMIAVFLSDTEPLSEWERSIFHAKNKKGNFELHCLYKPFFVRECETLGFVIEKIQNCCFDRMVWMQKRWQKKQEKEKKV